MLETQVDVYEEDLDFFSSPTTSAGDVSEHLSYMLSEARRKTEVSLRNLTSEERKLMEAAKDKSTSGFRIQFSK